MNTLNYKCSNSSLVRFLLLALLFFCTRIKMRKKYRLIIKERNYTSNKELPKLESNPSNKRGGSINYVDCLLIVHSGGARILNLGIR